MKNYMLLIWLLFLVHESSFTVCRNNGYIGDCVRFENCDTAMKRAEVGEDVQNCGTESDPNVFVCCYDHPVKITKRINNKRSKPQHKYNFDDTYEYDSEEAACQPIISNWTAPERGRKSWQKCLEYQDKLVYPCRRLQSLMPGKERRDLCKHSAEGLVVGGVNTRPYEFPHMVLLGYNFKSEPNNDRISRIQWLCGGSLISERYVLTAAHCLSDGNIREVKYVYVGGYKRTDMFNATKIYYVAKRIKYPTYKPSSKYNDIALLKLDRNVPLDETTVPACLYAGDKIDDSQVIATGWGMTEYQGGFSNILQKVVLNKFSANECYAHFPPDPKLDLGFDERTQLCYGDKNKSSDTCQGDSGSPIQIDSRKISCMFMIIGVTSFGRACGFVGQPAVYTRVESYVPWIESIVWPSN